MNNDKPGDTGLSIIDGHSGGWFHDGIFKNLNRLKTNDEFSVQYGDGSNKKFEVVKVQSVLEKDASPYLLVKDTNIAQQLNLITCGNQYDKSTGQYQNRIIVKAKAIE